MEAVVLGDGGPSMTKAAMKGGVRACVNSLTTSSDRRHLGPKNPDAAAARNQVMANVFITGGTGYIGQRLIPELLARRHVVRALVRNGSIAQLPAGAAAGPGHPLDRATV